MRGESRGGWHGWAVGQVILPAVYFVYYNFCRVRQRLRVTRAMEAGLSDRFWPLGKDKATGRRSVLDGLEVTI